MIPSKITPSMMCADLAHLPETLSVFAEEGIEYLHIDVMDGHFVNNLCLGTDFCRQMRCMSDIPLDLHLMIEGVLIMTVNPGFAGQKMIPATLDKIADCRRYLDERGYGHVTIEVDGNVSFKNARKMRAAGADLFVAGTSSVFEKDGDLRENIAKFREAIR